MADEVCRAKRRNTTDVQSQARAGRYAIALLSVEKNTEECVLVPEDCLPGGTKENEFLARCPHCGLELAAFQNVFMHFAGLEKTRKQKPGKKSKIKSVQLFDPSTSSFVDKPNPWRAAAKDNMMREPRPSTGSLPLPTFPGSHEPLRSLSEQPSASSLFRFPSAGSTPHQWMSQVPITSVASSTSILSHPDPALINARVKSAGTFPWQQHGAQAWPGQPHNPHLWAAAAWLQQPWAQSQWLLPPKDDPKSQMPFGVHSWLSGSSSTAEQNLLAQHAAATAQWQYDQPLSHRRATTSPVASGNKWQQDLQPPPKKQQCLNDRANSFSQNMWPNGSDHRADMSNRHPECQESRSALPSSNGRPSHSTMGSSGWPQAPLSANTSAATSTYTNWPGSDTGNAEQQQQNDCMHDERRHRKSHHHDQQQQQPTSSSASRKESKGTTSSQQQQQQQQQSIGSSSMKYRDNIPSLSAYNNNTLDRPPPWGGLAPQDFGRAAVNYSSMFDLRPPLVQDGWSSVRSSGMPMGWPMPPHNPGFNRLLDQVYLDGFHKSDAYNVSGICK